MEYQPVVKGKGSYWEISPGVYQFRYSMGKDQETGRYRLSPKRTLHCESKSPRGREAELRTAMEAYKQELNSGIVSRGKAKTVGEYAKTFHRLREGTMNSPLAYDREGYDIRHIDELFGNVRLTELRSGDIKAAYAEARLNGRFSDSELSRIHVKLKQILQDATNDELISRNPCIGISMPKPKGRDRQALSLEEASRFQACLLDEKPSSQVVGTLLLLDCGMRRGEALGLTWAHFDQIARLLHISQQYTNDKTLRSPKSLMSRRIVSPTPTLIAYLSQWKQIQKERLAEYSLEQTEDTPIVHGVSVFVDDCGERHAEVIHIDGHNYARWFRDFCVDNGFGVYEVVTKRFVRDGKEHVRGQHYKGLCPHMLRHTQATLLIGNGQDIKTVQARLGHASANTTLSIYSHAITANDRKASDVFDGLLNSERNEERAASSTAK